MEDAASLERQGREQLERATTAAELEDARVEVLGRSSALTLALRELGELPAELRGARGQDLNRVRSALEDLHGRLRERLESLELDAALRTEAVDVTLPGDPVPRGTAHLLTQIQREIEDVFVGLGFRIAEGPEVELEYYNFTALNTPDDHPSKAESDTLWIAPGVCLRTQTSPVQVRVMESQPPPVYVICPGRVYRRDALDPTHSPMFQQVEGLAVDRGLSLAHLKGTLEHFARALFGPAREIRLRAHFFPFTEPSVELDVSCFLCGGRAAASAGRGLDRDPRRRHGRPERVRLRPGYDPEVVTGWAFGMGIERVAMLKYGIPHVRASTTTTCASSSSSGGPCDEGSAAMARRPPRASCRRSTELVAQLSLAGDKVEGVERRGLPAVDGVEELIVAGLVRGGRQAPERRPPAAHAGRRGGGRAAPDRLRRLELRRRRHGRRRAARDGALDGRRISARSCAARPPTA